MGASLVKPVGELTSEEVAEALADLGTHYKQYRSIIVTNGVNGSLLDSLEDAEMEDTLDDLSITNRLHRRVLLKALKKAKMSMDFVSSEYNYSPSTPSSELEAYDRVTTMCFRNNNETAFLAGVHLCLKNGKQLSLGTKIIQDGIITSQRLHVKGELSICSSVADADCGQNYYKREVPEIIGEKLFAGLAPLTYTGFAVRNETGRKVGVVCIIDRCDSKRVDDVDREAFLRHMAMAVEKELKNRKLHLMIRYQTLPCSDDVANHGSWNTVHPLPASQKSHELISTKETSCKLLRRACPLSNCTLCTSFFLNLRQTISFVAYDRED
jgi:hypothetical protein